jgi:hypothetical protein
MISMTNIQYPKLDENVQLNPPFSRPEFTWTQTTTTPEYENDPMFLIETEDAKYLYDELMDALRDMIALNNPVQVYRWDRDNKRYVHYVNIGQTEEE